MNQTAEQIAAMSDGELNRWIAEAEGWVPENRGIAYLLNDKGQTIAERMDFATSLDATAARCEAREWDWSLVRNHDTYSYASVMTAQCSSKSTPARALAEAYAIALTTNPGGARNE